MVNEKLEEKRKHGNFLLPLGIYDVDLGDKEYSISAHWHKEVEIILVKSMVKDFIFRKLVVGY